MSAGYDHACAVDALGRAWCWGNGDHGQLGVGSDAGSIVPVAVTGLAPGVTSVNASWNYSCALVDGGTVSCWGSDLNGELGDGAGSGDSLVPVPIE